MRTLKVLLVALLLSLSTGAHAQERITLSVPVALTVTNWSIEVFALQPIAGRVTVRLVSNVATAERVDKVYDATTSPTGATLISGLNTANLTTRSLEARIYDRLIADGVFVGTVTGTPR